jgi:hypothetical protein
MTFFTIESFGPAFLTNGKLRVPDQSAATVSEPAGDL